MDRALSALHRLAAEAGLQREWEDAAGRPQRVGDDVLIAILTALGLRAENPRQIRESRQRLREEERAEVSFRTATVARPVSVPGADGGAAELLLEDGRRMPVMLSGKDGDTLLPGIDIPGYHRLLTGDREIRLAVAPERCFDIRDAAGERRIWGPAVQIAALRGRHATAFGGFAALTDAARAFAARGADALAISPVHALFPADPRRYSPYAPSSRLFLNVLHADPAQAGLAGFHDEAGGDLIDWSAAIPHRIRLLRHAFDARDDAVREQVARFARASGQELERHARFDALHAHFFVRDGARGWRDWPAAFHDPAGRAVTTFAGEHADEVDFHLFLQWLAQSGLARAQQTAKQGGMALGLIADLAVGLDPGGSQTWSQRDTLPGGLAIGAPPDPLGPDGQNWGITGFSPHALRRTGFAGFIATVCATLAHAGGVRIDHALGLRRLWVVPEGAPAVDGAYLGMPEADMLRLLALESWRAQAVVIGEDLGTVPRGFRSAMREKSISGMRVLWFQRDEDGFLPPGEWPGDAVSMTGTHDVPTVAGWWRGRDIDWSWKLGRAAPAASEAGHRRVRADERALLWQAFDEAGAVPLGTPEPVPDDTDTVTEAALAFVGGTPAELVLIPLEDIAGLPDQPNLPGTTTEYPNWRRRMPETTEALLDRAAVRRRLAALDRARAP